MTIEIVTPVMDRVLYSTSNYEVRITTIVEQQSSQDLVVYGIFNRDTGVREAELRGYAHAVKWADTLQGQLMELYTDRAKADAERNAIETALGEGADVEQEEETYEEPAAMTKEEATSELDSLVPSEG